MQNHDDLNPFPEYWDECEVCEDGLGDEVESRFAAFYAHANELEEFVIDVVDRCQSAETSLDMQRETRLRLLELQSANAAQKAIIANLQKKIETFEATIGKQRRIIEDLEDATDVPLTRAKLPPEVADGIRRSSNLAALAQEDATLWDAEDQEAFERSMDRDDRDMERKRRRLGLSPRPFAARFNDMLDRLQQKKD